jgi:hypothetical protein
MSEELRFLLRSIAMAGGQEWPDGWSWQGRQFYAVHSDGSTVSYSLDPYDEEYQRAGWVLSTPYAERQFWPHPAVAYARWCELAGQPKPEWVQL